VVRLACQQRNREQTAAVYQALRRQLEAHSHILLSTLSKSSFFAMGKRKVKACQHVKQYYEGEGEIIRFKLTISDCREFPSLSGAPQAQQNTTAQQMWSNPNLRTTQHSTIQRPQGQNPSQGQSGSSTTQQLQNQTHEDAIGAVQGQFPGSSDEYRFGGQAGVGQLSGGTQPQTGNIEEFPPLGGGAGDIGPDRRTGMIQNAAAYGGGANTTFPGLGQTRNGLSSPTDAQQDRSINTAVGSRGIHPGGGERAAPRFMETTHSSSITDAFRKYAGNRLARRGQECTQIFSQYSQPHLPIEAY